MPTKTTRITIWERITRQATQCGRPLLCSIMRFATSEGACGVFCLAQAREQARIVLMVLLALSELGRTERGRHGCAVAFLKWIDTISWQQNSGCRRRITFQFTEQVNFHKSLHGRTRT